MSVILIAIGLVAVAALVLPVVLALRRRNTRLAWITGVIGLGVQAAMLSYLMFGVEGYHDGILTLVVGFPIVSLAACIILMRIVLLRTRDAARE